MKTLITVFVIAACIVVAAFIAMIIVLAKNIKNE